MSEEGAKSAAAAARQTAKLAGENNQKKDRASPSPSPLFSLQGIEETEREKERREGGYDGRREGTIDQTAIVPPTQSSGGREGKRGGP